MTQLSDAIASRFRDLQDFWAGLANQQKSWIVAVVGLVLIFLALRRNVESEGWFLFYGFTGLICLAYAASLAMSHGG